MLPVAMALCSADMVCLHGAKHSTSATKTLLPSSTNLVNSCLATWKKRQSNFLADADSRLWLTVEIWQSTSFLTCAVASQDRRVWSVITPTLKKRGGSSILTMPQSLHTSAPVAPTILFAR